MINRTILVLALLLICAMAINWYQDRAERDREPPAVAVSEPDLYMVNALISQYDGSGDLHHQIRARRMTHYTVTDATLLEAPQVTLYADDGEPWQIGSGAGRIVPNRDTEQEVVELWDGVTAARHRADGRFITIVTERLTLVPGASFARTDQQVSIRTHRGSVDAAGMSAQLEPTRITFFSDEQQRVSTILTRR